MNRISAKMKLLSLAVLGLGGMALAGSAAAACPTALSPPWTSTLSTGSGSSVASVDGGYDGSSCKMQAALGQGTNANAKAAVLDDSPANEQRYRAQFIVDASGIALTQSNRAALIFNVIGSSAPANGTNSMLSVYLRGNGSASALRFLIGDTAQGSQYQTVDVPLPNTSGANRVEIDLVVGSAGSLKYWVASDSASLAEGSPTGSATNLANNGWGGVDKATLGLGGASAAWRSNFSSTSYVYFDQFDSRRSTFIGH